VAVIVAGLLVVPHIRFDLLGYSGWLSAYLVFGLVVPPVMEWIVRRRSLSVIGFRAPINPRMLIIVAIIMGLYVVARVAQPLVGGEGFALAWPGFFSTVILFPFLEETLFRGLIQTRLESALGAVQSWIWTGLLFACYHGYVHYLVPGRALAAADALGLIYLATFGMLLGVIFAKTRSLLPPFLIHAVNNLSL